MGFIYPQSYPQETLRGFKTPASTQGPDPYVQNPQSCSSSSSIDSPVSFFSIEVKNRESFGYQCRIMKRLTFIIILLHVGTSGFAQTIISGEVVDEKGAGLIGVNVYIQGTYDGAATDMNGKFAFETGASGRHILIASCIGFITSELPVHISEPTQELAIILKEEINKIDGVTITAGAFEASDTKKSVVLRTIDIVTTAGATADISGVMNTLPGTQTVGEEGRLFVRGGAGREAKTFINGMVAADPYSYTPNNIPSRFRYSPFLFKGACFSTGGYSAEYGQALSSVLQLNTLDLPARTQTDISLMSVGADIGQSLRINKTSAYGQVQYTDLQPYFLLVPQEAAWQRAPHSVNATLHLKQRFGKSGSAQWYNNLDRSAMAIEQPMAGNIHQNLMHHILATNMYSNLSVKNSIGEKMSYSTGFSYTENSNAFAIENKHLNVHARLLHAKLVLDQEATDKVSMKYGAEWFGNDYHENSHTGDTETAFNARLTENQFSAFAESEIYFSNKLMIRAGIRAEHSDLTDTIALFPRASIAWKIAPNSQVSCAYGRFAQSADMEYLKWQPTLRHEEAEHYIISYQYTLTGRIFRAEAYYKNYNHLVTSARFTEDQPITDNGGYGYARGFELFWRDSKSLKNVDYWLSYSFLDTERKYGIFPYPVMPYYASAHNLSLVYKHFVIPIRTQVGATFSVTSGRPYTDPNTGAFNSRMTPAYKDLSINASYLMKPNMILHASITNVPGFDNIFGYRYNAIPNEEGLYESTPIVPQARRFVFIGLFITISKDKNANQLNNL